MVAPPLAMDASALAASGVSVSVRVRPHNDREGSLSAWKTAPGAVGTPGQIAQLDAADQPIAKATYAFGGFLATIAALSWICACTSPFRRRTCVLPLLLLLMLLPLLLLLLPPQTMCSIRRLPLGKCLTAPPRTLCGPCAADTTAPSLPTGRRRPARHIPCRVGRPVNDGVILFVIYEQ